MDSGQSESERGDSRWLTLPNVITIVRICGSPLLIVLAFQQQHLLLGVLTGLLVLTEWLDGFLARALHLESATGARLDTIADAFFYSSMLIAVGVLVPDRIRQEAYWIAAAIGSYLGSWLASWLKFRRLPSYHTWMAKGAWFVVGPGVLLLALGWDFLVIRVAMVVVVLANLEAIAITLRLEKARVDVPSIWHARRQANEKTDS